MKIFSKTSVNKFYKYSPIIILVLVVIYSFNTNKNQNKLEEEFKKEKQILEKELDKVIADYKKITVRKKGLSRRIITSINKIIALKDSIKEIKGANHALLAKYTLKAAKLERDNRNLYIEVNRLQNENEELLQKNEIAKNTLRAHKKTHESLLNEKKVLLKEENELKSKISTVAKVEVGKVSINAFKEKRNGKYVNTSRSSKTDAFKVKFDLLENVVANPGERDVYIQIVDDEGEVVFSEKSALKNEANIACNDAIKVDYRNQQIGVVSLISVDKNQMRRGNYVANVYIGDRKVGASSILLK